MPKSRLWTIIIVAIVSAAAGVWLAASLRPSGLPQLQAGTGLDPARALPDVSLLDGSGNSFTKQRLQGRWTLLFFGFTNCPDVCPTTLALLAQVRAALTDLPATQQPQVVFVSVDPKRDGPAQVAAYTRFFNSEFIGVTGEQAQIDLLTRGMGVPVIIQPLANGGYTVDHSAAIFLVDPQAKLRALFSAPHKLDTLISDFRVITQS